MKIIVIFFVHDKFIQTLNLKRIHCDAEHGKLRKKGSSFREANHDFRFIWSP